MVLAYLLQQHWLRWCIRHELQILQEQVTGVRYMRTMRAEDSTNRMEQGL